MPSSSELEYWSGSAWVKEHNLIQLTVKDRLQEPLVLNAMIGNFSDSALNTRESNYGKFLKVRVKEKFSSKYIFYGKIVKTSPDRDATWGHVVYLTAIDNLRELSNLRIDDDITGQTTRSGLISTIISNNVWTTSGVPNIAVNDSTKFKTSTSSESSGVLDKTLKGDRKPILDIMQEVAREDPTGHFFGYDFYLDAEFNGNTATPDLFYFPRGSIPAGTMPASGLTLQYAATESNQVLPIMGDYNFPRQSSELITRVLLRWIDLNDKPRKTDCILINHGATSGGNFDIGDTITWSGSGSAKVLLVGSNNRWLVIGPDSVDVDDNESNSNWLNAISGLAISGGGASATANAVTANPPGSLRESIEQEAEVVSQVYDISSAKGAAVHAASILYQGGDIITRGNVKILKWPQYKITGTHTGSNNAGTLTDSTKTFTNFGIFKSDVIQNTTDDSQATITSVGGTTISGSLSGGTDNNWDTNDTYEISVPIRTGHLVYVNDIPSGSGISNQVCLVTAIEYTEGPGIQISNIKLLIASDGRGTIPTILGKQITKQANNASSVPANDQSGIMPRGIQNWTTSIVFTPDGTNSHNTVDWGSATIFFFDGTDYAINSGTTGAVSGTAYIYWSKSSPTILQTTTNPQTAKGPDNLVLATVTSVASGGTVLIETATGVPQKNYYTLDALFDGAQYGRIAIGNLLSNNLNLAAASLNGELPLSKTSETSSRKHVSANQRDGGGYAHTGLNSQGFIKQNHFLNDLGIGIRSGSSGDSTYTAILGAGIVGINGSTTMFQIQSSDGKAGFGGQVGSSSVFKCILDEDGVTLGTGASGGHDEIGFLNFKGSSSSHGVYSFTNLYGALVIFGNGGTIYPNSSAWTFGGTTTPWGYIYGINYYVKKSGSAFATLSSNADGDLLWDGSAISGGASLSGTNTWTGANTFSAELRGSKVSTTLPSIYAVSAPIQTNKGMWFGDESTPGSPNSGFIRLYSDGNVLKYKKSSGTIITLDGSGSGGGTIQTGESQFLALYEGGSSGDSTTIGDLRQVHGGNVYGWKTLGTGSLTPATHGINGLGLLHSSGSDIGVMYIAGKHDAPCGDPPYSFSGRSSTGMSYRLINGGANVCFETNDTDIITIGLFGMKIWGNRGFTPNTNLSGWIGSQVTNLYSYSVQNDRRFILGAFNDISTTGSIWMHYGDYGESNYLEESQLHVKPAMFYEFASTNSQTSVDLVVQTYNNNERYRVARESSTIRNKENVRDIEVNTEKIYDLVPRTFEWKNSGETAFGLIAEEVDEVIPALVTRWAEPVLDENGIPNEDGDPIPQGVDYKRIAVLVLTEMKKLKERIDVLEGS